MMAANRIVPHLGMRAYKMCAPHVILHFRLLQGICLSIDKTGFCENIPLTDSMAPFDAKTNLKPNLLPNHTIS